MEGESRDISTDEKINKNYRPKVAYTPQVTPLAFAEPAEKLMVPQISNLSSGEQISSSCVSYLLKCVSRNVHLCQSDYHLQ